MNMNGRFKTDDIDKYFDYNINLITRTLYMGSVYSDGDNESGTDAKMAELVIKGLHVLDNMDKTSDNGESPITIVMNNLGGDYYHGMAIYDAISLCKNRVEINVYGRAMSMGSIIIQAGDVRRMTKHASMLIHYGEGGYIGNTLNAIQWAEEDKRINAWMEDMYLEKIHEKHPTFSRERLQKWLTPDKFMTAEEAVKWNLIDEVMNP